MATRLDAQIAATVESRRDVQRLAGGAVAAICCILGNTWNQMLVWDAQIAATVQVRESSFSEVGEIASDGPEARLLPCVASSEFLGIGS